MRRTLLMSLALFLVGMGVLALPEFLPSAAAWQQNQNQQNAGPVPQWVWGERVAENQVLLFRKTIAGPE